MGDSKGMCICTIFGGFRLMSLRVYVQLQNIQGDDGI